MTLCTQVPLVHRFQIYNDWEFFLTERIESDKICDLERLHLYPTTEVSTCSYESVEFQLRMGWICY